MVHVGGDLPTIPQVSNDSAAVIFGRRVRDLRTQRGLTQEELAKKIDLDPKHLGRLERGEHGPTFPTLGKVAEALDVQVYELFLPTALTSSPLASATGSVLESIEKVGPERLKEFFGALLTALNHLESSTADPPKGRRRTK